MSSKCNVFHFMLLQSCNLLFSLITRFRTVHPHASRRYLYTCIYGANLTQRLRRGLIIFFEIVCQGKPNIKWNETSRSPVSPFSIHSPILYPESFTCLFTYARNIPPIRPVTPNPSLIHSCKVRQLTRGFSTHT